MGGRGGLNILPQKKWNVYNWDNRIKVMENEKIVEEEISKIKKRKKDKRLDDIVRQIKSSDYKTKFNQNDIEVDDEEKNKIFKEVMSRKSMEKRLKVDLWLEKMNTPMKYEERLKLFDDENNIGKKESTEDKNITFRESIKNHLEPWYMKKNPDDYKYYRDYLKNKKSNENNSVKDDFLKKKHKKEEKKKTIEDLREERIKREQIERLRIQTFLSK
jgi:hypothetical protein